MVMELRVTRLIFGRPAERRRSVLLCMETLRARIQVTRYLRINRCSTMSGSADSRENIGDAPHISRSERRIKFVWLRF